MLDWQRIGEAQVNVVLRLKLRHLRTHAIIERTLDADQKVRRKAERPVSTPSFFWGGRHFLQRGRVSEKKDGRRALYLMQKKDAHPGSTTAYVYFSERE